MRGPILLLACLFTALPASAAEAPYVPPELEPWREWVLQGEEHRSCPLRFDRDGRSRDAWYCAWPGPLVVDARAGEATFSQRWDLAIDTWVPLPGNAAHWPRDVQRGATRVAVVEREGAPHVWLEAGAHTLTGRLVWVRRPAALPVPPLTGLVALTLDGAPVTRPERAQGTLWLGKRPGEALPVEPQQVEVSVYRLLQDGVPMTLTTSIEVAVSGTPREAVLGRILPDGFAPVSLASPLPARIEADGRLRLQLRPGNWPVQLVARATGIPAAFAFEATGDPWADEEIWSYRADPPLRTTLVEGEEPVDPRQVDVPQGWRQLPAFRLMPGATLRIVERMRGRAAELANRLQLVREMWLDFSGDGFTLADRIHGQMETGWRLDMVSPYELASARIGEDYRLVTQVESDATLRGVELREPAVDLMTLARVPKRGAMPATGWLARFDEVSAVVHIPFGYELLAVTGADVAAGTWVNRWRLVDYFLVLLIAVSFWRLFGLPTGLVALAMLVLTYHEPDALLWSWLAALVAVALARHAPEGGLREVSKWARHAALVSLIVLAVVFSAVQLRAALFPQLDPVPARGVTAMRDMARTEAVPAAPPVPMGAEAPIYDPKGKVAAARVTTQQARPPRFEPGALLQTGPGMPAWVQKTYRIAWNGPVGESQSMRLVVLDARLYRLLRVLGVGLIGWLIWRLLRDSYPRWRIPRGTHVPVIAVGLAATIMNPGPVSAEIPDPALLEELRTRLTEAPECAPRCAEIAEARLAIDDDTLRGVLVVQAQHEVALPLPGLEAEWSPASVRRNDAAVAVMRRNGNGELLIRIPPGTHLVRFDGPLAGADSLRLSFPLAARHVEVAAEGWEYSGLVENRLPGGTLELVRTRDAKQDPALALEPERFPPFVRVTRRVVFDVDWRVYTTVARMAPEQGGFTVNVPLLDGERVLSESIRVRDGAAIVPFGVAEQSVSYESTLPRSSQLLLSAPLSDTHREVWQLLASPSWRIGFEGTPLIGAAGDETSSWIPEFRPRPGETLTIAIDRPVAVEGRTLAFDRVDATTTVGKRTRETHVALEYRASRGGQHAVLLPADAQVLEVLADGESLAVRPSNGELQLPIVPGSHRVDVRFDQQRTIRARTSTPLVHIGAPGSNVGLQLNLPSDRWVLWADGPRTGPAVLYWSELAVFVLIALALGRLHLVPLRTWEWVALGVGFSTHAWPVLILIATWLFAFAWRLRGTMPVGRIAYNLVQVVFGVLSFAVVAALIVAIPAALIGTPDMSVTGNQSTAHHLAWFADRTGGAVPAAHVWSVPLWIYKTALLLWALWLSFALIGWLRWAWQGWTRGGIWRMDVKRGLPEESAATEPPTA